MSGCARFILVNYKQDLLGKNTVNNIGTFVLKGNELQIYYMSACARFILVNYKQDLLGENTVDNTVDQKIALPFYVMLILHLVIWRA